MAPSWIPGNLDEKKAARRGRSDKKTPMRRFGLLGSGRLLLNLQEKLYRIKEARAAVCVLAHTGAESLSSPSQFGSVKKSAWTERVETRLCVRCLYRNPDWVHRRRIRQSSPGRGCRNTHPAIR